MKEGSNDNTLFTTEQCNNHCLMCCQPPHRVDDIDYWFERNLKILEDAPDNLPTIGISGGEPTLLGERLFELIDIVRGKYPSAEIHLLSNGRSFKDDDYTHKLKIAAGEKLVVGVPLHSDFFRDHDIIAGAKGAYYETIEGLYNLAAEEIEIELRIVLTALNVKRLPQMAEFIFKNLPFVSWVALMGLERTGLAVKNLNRIWAEPMDYVEELHKAVQSLDASGIEAVIYNIPLCLLPESLHPFAAQSISDWKVKYAPMCESCIKKDQCCGLFATSNQTFNGLKPFKS